MSAGIIIAIVVSVLIVLIAAGVGYYVYSSQEVAVTPGLYSTTDGPVVTIDRTSAITGSNYNPPAQQLAEQTAPLFTQQNAPAATQTMPAATQATPPPKTEPPVDTALINLNSELRNMMNLRDIVRSGASLGEKTKAVNDAEAVVARAKALPPIALDKPAADKVYSNILDVKRAIDSEYSKYTQTTAAPATNTWNSNIPRLASLMTTINNIYMTVRSNVAFDAKITAAQSLPPLNIFTMSVDQEIKNAASADIVKDIERQRSIGRMQIDEINKIIAAGPPPPKTATGTTTVGGTTTATPPVVDGAAQYNILKAQIDAALAVARMPTVAVSTKIAELQKIPSDAIFKEATARAVEAAKLIPGIDVKNMQTNILNESTIYINKIRTARGLIISLGVSPCGNTNEHAGLLGCTTRPFMPLPWGICPAGQTTLPCAIGCKGKICIKGPAPGALAYTNMNNATAYFK